MVGLLIAGVVGVELSPRGAAIMPGMRGIDAFADDSLVLRVRAEFSSNISESPDFELDIEELGSRSRPVESKSSSVGVMSAR